MRNYSKTINPEATNRNDEDFFEGASGEDRALFKRALSDAEDLKLRKIEEEIKDMETLPPSKRHRIRMNRLFRERVGGTFIPFPEVDNLYERVRSRLVIKLKLNECFDGRKTCRRAR